MTDYADHRAGATPAAPKQPAPRVLFVDNQVGDFLQSRVSLARAMMETGFDVHVAVPREAGVEEISRQGFHVHTFFIRRMSTMPLNELRCCVSLLRLYRRLRPSLVHHICLKPALYGGIAARFAGVPATVSTLTGLGHLSTTGTVRTRVLRSIVGGGLRFSFGHQNTIVSFQTSHDCDALLASGIARHQRTVLIKGSGVDLSSFRPTPEPDGPPVVLMASRLLWSKGVGDFVAAARELRARGLRTRFVLLGDRDPGHPCAVPARTLEEWRDAGDVECLGWRRDMPAAIAQSHVVCLPTAYGEGIPRILVEAAASGRPIVASDSPGCREIVRDTENGLLVPAGDRDALVGAIARLVQDGPMRAAMGTRGRAIAVADFSLEQVIEANLAAYRVLLESIPRAWNLLIRAPA